MNIPNDIPFELSEEEKRIMRKNRKKTNVGESIHLFTEIMESVNDQKKIDEDIEVVKDIDVEDLPLSVEDLPIDMAEKETSSQESDSEEEISIDDTPKIIFDYKNSRIISIRTTKDFIEYYEPASNFILTPLYRILEDGGNQKHYVKIDNGYEVKHVIIDGETLSINRSFKSFCRQKGDFNWKGNTEDLNQLNDYMIQQRCDVVEQVKYIGYLYDSDYLLEDTEEDSEEKRLFKQMPEDIWVFPTHAYYNGDLYLPDEDHIFRFPTKNILLDFDRSDNIAKIHIKKRPTKNDVVNVLSNLQELYGHYTWLGIGFMIASLQVSTISQLSHQFPYFYPVGIRNTGKTEYTTFMYKFAGIDAVLEAPPLRIDPFRKHLRWYSNLPFGYDEAQQQGESKKDKDFFVRFTEELKTIFNRKGFYRGDKDPDKLVKYPARAALTFSGEVATNETAIKSRTIFIDALNFHHDEESFDELMEREDTMYWLGQYMMRTAHEWRVEFIMSYKALITEMKGIEQYKKVSSRVRKNYAIILAGVMVFMKRIAKEFDIILYNQSLFNELKLFALKEMLNSQKEVEDQHQSITFLSEIASLAKSGTLEKNVDYKVELGENILYLSPNEAWNAYKKQHFKSSYTSTNAIASDLRAYSFFKGSKSKKIGGKTLHCWMFDLSDEKVPEFFHHFVEPNVKTYDPY